ncbi:MAG: Stk1 family PASTA domain-containing Ser/Thr kinase [Actinomycetota bacterium]|nr:Stk1 family PASTA domain-containing Ser/Thr kinase [Actinomycetota bacterium]
MQQLVDNRYRLVKPLGSGGMADVYLAHDNILDRDVALKVMSTRYASDEEFVERFKREAQSAAALSHPNIVSIFDRGESEDGTYYIAMEYLPGGTLKDRIMGKGALPARTAAAVALQIAEALRAAHERGVIHRDIKPHNILITESGDVKVTDFGIARAASSSTMTRTGSILGTAHYISPEQAMGEPVGPASDLYSLGVVLYEMLTGELPYDADTPLGIAMKHVNGRLSPPMERDPSISAGINAVTVRLLAKDPADRYASDAELIEDLERVAAGLEPANATTEMITRLMPPAPTTRVGPPPPPYGGRRNEKRRRFAPVILALLALLLVIPLAWAGYQLLQDRQQEEQVPPIAVPDLVGKTLDEAENQVGDRFDIRVEDEVANENPVDTILSQRPEAGRAEKGSTISVVVVGTQVAEVPNVVGQKRAAAAQTLENARFTVAVQERESSFEKEGRIIGQTPGGGTSEEVGSEVTLIVGTGPSSVQVPDLSGNNPDQAAAVLGGVGLEIGAVSEEYNAELAQGLIFYQDPAAGQSVEPGSAVNVTVSLGPEPVEVPEVFGMDLQTAQQTVVNAGLRYTTFEVEDNEPEGTALSTEPGAGTLVDPGTTVTIYYSSGPPPEPDPAAEDREEARKEAQEARKEARKEAQEAREEAREEAQDANEEDKGNSGRGNKE